VRKGENENDANALIINSWQFALKLALNLLFFHLENNPFAHPTNKNLLCIKIGEHKILLN